MNLKMLGRRVMTTKTLSEKGMVELLIALPSKCWWETEAMRVAKELRFTVLNSDGSSLLAELTLQIGDFLFT